MYTYICICVYIYNICRSTQPMVRNKCSFGFLGISTSNKVSCMLYVISWCGMNDESYCTYMYLCIE